MSTILLLSCETDALEVAVMMVARGDGDDLLVITPGTEIPGVQHDDGETCIAAIDLVRAVVDDYEAKLCADCLLPLDEHCESCGECGCENEECQDEDSEEN